MSVRPLTYLLVFALGIGAAGLSACGSSSSKALIPVADAGPLHDDLDSIAAAIDDNDCPRAAAAIRRAQAHVDSLPRATSDRLTQRLREGLRTLQTQAADECVAPVDTTTTETQPTETLPTDTTTETLPTDTTTTPTDTTTETLPTDTTTTPTVPTPTPDPGGTEPPPGPEQQQPDGGTLTP